jgi:hypothetical protein
MARYNSFNYNTGVVYGDTSSANYSVAPFSVKALDYNNTVVSWNQPANSSATPYTRFRIVRNHTNPSETPEDGLIIWDRIAPFNTGIARVIDGLDVNNEEANVVYFTDHRETISFTDAPAILPQGKIIYYSAWVLRTDGGNAFWYKTSDAEVLFAKDHYTVLGNTDDTLKDPHLSRTRTRSTQDKIIELFPKVFTSSSESPLDVIDENSDFYQFIKGITYTYDELLTYTDLLLPNHTAENYSRNFVEAKSYELAIAPDSQNSLRTQRALLRESTYIYGRKGTALGVGTLVEAMVGYNTTVVPFNNLILSIQDNTFYKGVGNWANVANVTVTANTVQAGPDATSYAGDLYDSATSSYYSTDSSYCGKFVVAATPASVTNGTAKPITQGMPVIAGQTYRLSFYNYVVSGTPTVTPTISWYDYTGKLLSSSAGSALSTSTTWTKRTANFTAPTNASYAAITLEFNTATTYYIDLIHFAPYFTVTAASSTGTLVTYTAANKLSVGQRISITGVSTAFNLTNVVVESIIKNSSGVATGFTVRNSATDTAVIEATGAVNYPYEDARAAIIRVDPSKVNFVKNPSFEATSGYSTGWTASSTSQVTDAPIGVLSGTKCLQATLGSSAPIKVTTSGGNQYGGAITPGKWYTFSIYVKPTAANITVGLYLKATSGANSITNTKFLIPNSTTPVTSTVLPYSSGNGAGYGWNRYEVPLFLPADYSETTLEAGVTGTSGTVLVDAAQIEAKYSATDYVDGNNLLGGAEWENGVANGAITYYFANKPFRFPRLVEELPKYLSTNTPYLVISADGVEFLDIAS